jgi:hypothetical protein
MQLIAVQNMHIIPPLIKKDATVRGPNSCRAILLFAYLSIFRSLFAQKYGCCLLLGYLDKRSTHELIHVKYNN